IDDGPEGAQSVSHVCDGERVCRVEGGTTRLHHRFRPRFRSAQSEEQMRSYLLLACALVFSLPAAEVAGLDTQWVEDAGGTGIKDAAGKITGVDLRASWVTDSDLRRLKLLPDLTAVDLSLTRITDQGMQELKSLTGIVDLNLYFAEYVTDEGMAA